MLEIPFKNNFNPMYWPLNLFARVARFARLGFAMSEKNIEARRKLP